MLFSELHINGLTNQEIEASRKKFGENKLVFKRENGVVIALKSIASDPMVILLFVAATIYFISGKTSDGIFLSSAIIFEITISLYQDSRSRNALEKLKQISQATCKVIRNGKVVDITSEELVIGDFLMIEEGTSITADGTIVHANDFTVNESILTGESFAVSKSKETDNNQIYKGTTVVSGLAIAQITAIGNNTKLGKIGKSLEEIKEEKTPLEIQITNFVEKMVIIGAFVFAIVWIINYTKSLSVLQSLLQALTLAMSIMPEEIPVAFTTFMALGAWRLMKMGIVVKQMKTVETLGSATVICTDKTGTLTENKMSLAKVFVFNANKMFDLKDIQNEDAKRLIRLATFASEPIAFDPMEIALHEAYKKTHEHDERKDYSLKHEYALGGKPPMMTHVFENSSGERIIAAKGAPEALMNVSSLSDDEKKEITDAVKVLAGEGYRLLGVGQAEFNTSNFPTTQQEFKFTFVGLVAFYDPPKSNISKVLQDFYSAGIGVKIITGDNSETTISIAKQIGLRGYENSISGDELMKLSEPELQAKVMDVNIFTRMFPEAKLKIINALKTQNQIVAMTGDGVNDGPALKAAHIGIAMGKKGTEIAKQAASLILLEDDLAMMVDAVAMGRKIYTNLKKAIQYIISIHIPIIFTVFIPLTLGWKYPNIFSPVHVIFLELIMGPTCSIIYENEPLETNLMQQKPRPFTVTFFNWKELTTSIIQGVVITLGTLFTYQYAIYNNYNEDLTRTVIFTTLIAANIFLTLVNRSFYYSVYTTLFYKNNLVILIIGITISVTMAILYINPITRLFQFEHLTIMQLLLSVLIGFISVIWYEVIKIFNRRKKA